MISCVLKGGIGNMMFEIAFLEYESRRTGFAAGYYNIDTQINDINNYPAYAAANAQDYLKMFKHFTWPKINKPSGPMVNAPFPYKTLTINDNTNYNGYFQSEKYFPDREFILSLFEPSDFVNEQLIKYDYLFNSTTCSIHVRRGDYLTFSSIHKSRDIQYYKKAMDTVGDVNKYLIFSDDIQWCKTEFLGDQFIFIENEKDYVELFLQSKCDHNIISSSTFSWWGAYLNNKPNRISVGPAQWFASTAPTDLIENNIVPESWQTIDDEAYKPSATLTENSLIGLYNKNKINYNDVKDSCTFNMPNTNDVDVSIIVPVMGRVPFHNPLIDHLKRAIKNTKDKTFSITIIEHTDLPEHKNLCNLNRINYIHIPKSNDKPFNKCLCMNVGYLHSNTAKYYLFHDIDLLMNKDYFVNIFKNVKRTNDSIALQALALKRVIVMTEEQTDSIINKQIILTDIAKPEYCLPGAPGGSIFIKGDYFKTVGGYDAEFFYGYSPEDQFFYDKLELTVGIEGCNSPIVELYHMDHPRMQETNPDLKTLRNICFAFIALGRRAKLNFINHISTQFKKL
tara:strand:- start:487 stop:2181 length:1695 start_codon:yes stop_codon:yes gene_type:complete